MFSGGHVVRAEITEQIGYLEQRKLKVNELEPGVFKVGDFEPRIGLKI